MNRLPKKIKQILLREEPLEGDSIFQIKTEGGIKNTSSSGSKYVKYKVWRNKTHSPCPP